VLAIRDCVIGVGANLGERERTFSWTLEQLAKIGQLLALSNVYENPAVGGPPQPDYLNAAVRLRSALPPLGLLAAIQKIEQLAGRERGVHWGPRTLDLDLLWIPDQIVEVAPRATDPVTQLEYAAVLESHRVDNLRLHCIAMGPPWNWQPVRSRTEGVQSTWIAE